jgi:hypothetical protein
MANICMKAPWGGVMYIDTNRTRRGRVRVPESDRKRK